MVCIFLRGTPEFFLLEGGWWLSRTHIPNQTWLLPTNAVPRCSYAKQHLRSILQLFPCCMGKHSALRHGWWPGEPALPPRDERPTLAGRGHSGVGS